MIAATRSDGRWLSVPGVLVLGIFFVFRQVLILWPEVNWLRRYIHREEGAPPPRGESLETIPRR